LFVPWYDIKRTKNRTNLLVRGKKLPFDIKGTDFQLLGAKFMTQNTVSACPARRNGASNSEKFLSDS
jgi:hypothetical protein